MSRCKLCSKGSQIPAVPSQGVRRRLNSEKLYWGTVWKARVERLETYSRKDLLLKGLSLPWWLSGEQSPCQCRRHWFNPCVRKIPGEGNGNPLQYSCLKNPMDRNLATVHGVAKSLVELRMQRNKTWFLKYKADKNETGPESRWGPEEAGLLHLCVSWRELEPASCLLPKGSQGGLSCLSFLKTLGPQSSN